MCRISLLAALCCAPALAQSPPTPDAVLVAGATTSRAVDLALNPLSLALAPDTSIYVAETRGVWRVSTNGLISPVPGPWEGNQNYISAIATDRAGNLYVAEIYQHLIWKLTPQGQATAIAGQGQEPLSAPGPVPANSVATQANALAVDSQGNVYVSGNNGRVWKISPGGLIRTFAGNGPSSSLPRPVGPIPALDYSLVNPGRLAIDNQGNVYINDGYGLLRVSSDGLLRRVSDPVSAVAVDASGNLYAGLPNSGYSAGQIARIAADGSSHIVAGNNTLGFSDGCTADAPASNALRAGMGVVSDLAVGADGTVFFVDPANARVRAVSPDGHIRTVAGGPGGAFGGDGGPATEALLAHPTGLAFDSTGNLYLADRANNRIRRVDPAGRIETVVGGGATVGQDAACVAPAGLSAGSRIQLSNPNGVAVDPEDNVYIADSGNGRILKMTPAGEIAEFAKGLDIPEGVAFGFGNLYVTEENRISSIGADGAVATLYAPIYRSTSIAVDAAGNIFAGDRELTHDGHVFTLPVLSPRAWTAAPGGGAYFSDYFRGMARLDSDCSVTTLFDLYVAGVVVAPNGDLVVSDAIGNRIWRVPPPRATRTFVPLSLPNPSVVNGATLTPRSMIVQQITRFGTFPSIVPLNEAVAPGETVAIAGMCLAPLHPKAAQGYETQVLFNGVPAPLLSTSPNQLVAVVPYESSGETTATMEVRYRDQQAVVKLETAATSVGIFPVDGATYARGSVVSLRITGEGQTDPPGITGQPAGDTPVLPLAPVQVKVGDAVAEVVSVGPDPGTIGSTRVTFRVPESAAPGAARIAVSVGSSSNSIGVIIR